MDERGPVKSGEFWDRKEGECPPRLANGASREAQRHSFSLDSRGTPARRVSP